MKLKEPDLDKVVFEIYGQTLTKYKNVKTAYSIFTPYKDTQTQKIIYFYLLKVDSKYHVSDGTIEYALKKYNPFLSKVEFTFIQKNFDYGYYLIKSENSLISLNELIILQKQCQEIMEKQYILKTIQFLIDIYKQKKCSQFPQLTPKSLGINQQGHLKICDYEFYFKKQFEMRTLTQNLCSCLNPMIKLSVFKSCSRIYSPDDQIQRLKEYYGESFANLLKALILDPMNDMEKEGMINGQGKQVNIKKVEEQLQEYYKTADNDTNTTLNQTFEQDFKHEPIKLYKQYSKQNSLLTAQSIKQPFLFRDEGKKSKRKRAIIIGSIIFSLVLIITGALLYFMYSSSQIQCQVGQFRQEGSKECLPCTQGCLRCESQLKHSCFSCSGKMFLVLNNQNDTTGSCQTTCVGIVLRSNLCLKNQQKGGNTNAESSHFNLTR